jgi:hypothetical protein
MTRTLIAALLAALLLTGCFGTDEQPAAPPPPADIDDGVSDEDAARPALSLAPADPTPAARKARPNAEMKARLDAGEVAVVDLEGRIGIRPDEITFAKGGVMVDLKWRRWSDREAVGTGRMDGVVCDPDCGRGRTISAPATIRLSKPVACGHGRFFDLGRIAVRSDDPDADSNSWLAAPC